RRWSEVTGDWVCSADDRSRCASTTQLKKLAAPRDKVASIAARTGVARSPHGQAHEAPSPSVIPESFREPVGQAWVAGYRSRPRDPGGVPIVQLQVCRHLAAV